MASHLQLTLSMAFRSLAASVLLGVALGGCALAGRTFGTYVDDKMITGSVKRGLVAEPAAGLPRIKVDTYEGTVYLSGEVETAAQKADAEAAAWRVEGVEQVVNDLHVRAADAAVSALPRMSAAGPLQTRLPGLRRVDPAPPGEGALAYDRAGAIVATVYVRPLREVAEKGSDDLGPAARPITHVSLYPSPAGGVQPEALVTIVLWHISPAAAAALK